MWIGIGIRIEIGVVDFLAVGFVISQQKADGIVGKFGSNRCRPQESYRTSTQHMNRLVLHAVSDHRNEE